MNEVSNSQPVFSEIISRYRSFNSESWEILSLIHDKLNFLHPDSMIGNKPSENVTTPKREGIIGDLHDLNDENYENLVKLRFVLDRLNKLV